MTTNQTIDGVPVFYAIDAPNAYPLEAGTLDRIERSDGALWVHLNGKRSKLIGLQSLDFLISQLKQIKGEVFGTEPAARPQGEPVAYRAVFSDGEKSKWEDGTPQSQDLYDVRDGVTRGVELAYAEQPAPVQGEPVAIQGKSLESEIIEMANAQPYFIECNGRNYENPEVNTWKWFRWNGEHRPINKYHVCDVVTKDGCLLFSQSPYDFDWGEAGNVLAARHGPEHSMLDDADPSEQPAPVAVVPASQTCCGSCPGGCVIGAKP